MGNSATPGSESSWGDRPGRYPVHMPVLPVLIDKVDLACGLCGDTVTITAVNHQFPPEILDAWANSHLEPKITGATLTAGDETVGWVDADALAVLLNEQP